MNSNQQLTSVVGLFVVERIAGDQSASVQAGRQDKLVVGEPLLDGQRFGLHLVAALLEDVGEVAVQVESVGVVAALHALAVALARHFETVRIELSYILIDNSLSFTMIVIIFF